MTERGLLGGEEIGEPGVAGLEVVAAAGGGLLDVIDGVLPGEAVGALLAARGEGEAELGGELKDGRAGEVEELTGKHALLAAERGLDEDLAREDGGDLGGLKLADAICANLADDQGWPDGLQYRAWLSDSSRDARDRLKRGRGRLVLVNGLVLAQSWEALLAGELENPLEVTEKSETYHGGVWTGTRPDGTAVPEGQHCEAWKTQSIFPTGHFGYSDRLMGEWTLAIDADQPATCYVDFAIYCFQSL